MTAQQLARLAVAYQAQAAANGQHISTLEAVRHVTRHSDHAEPGIVTFVLDARLEPRDQIRAIRPPVMHFEVLRLGGR